MLRTEKPEATIDLGVQPLCIPVFNPSSGQECKGPGEWGGAEVGIFTFGALEPKASSNPMPLFCR